MYKSTKKYMNKPGKIRKPHAQTLDSGRSVAGRQPYF